MASALDHLPDLLAGPRVIGIHGPRADADHEVPAVDLDDLRRGKALAKISVGFRPSVGADILKVNRSLGSPHRLAGVLVECDDELMIAAVEVHQQKVVVD